MGSVDFVPQPVHYHQVTPPDPGANTNYTYTVPDNTAIELIALYTDFVAGVGAHVVNVHVQIDYHSAATICQVLQIWGPLGGSTTHLSFALELAYTHISNVDMAGRQNLPERIYLYPTNTIILSMANNLATDAFTNISLYLRSWIME